MTLCETFYHKDTKNTKFLRLCETFVFFVIKKTTLQTQEIAPTVERRQQSLPTENGEEPFQS